MHVAIGVFIGATINLAAWAFVWRTQWWPRHEQQIYDRDAAREQARTLELAARTWEDANKATGAQLDEVRRRAETAEGIARGQAKHIEALQRSNDKMLETITDMRRVGFSLPDDILREASDDRVTTVQDDDREYVSEHPHLAAGDLD